MSAMMIILDHFDLIEFDSIGCNAMRCDDEVLFLGSQFFLLSQKNRTKYKSGTDYALCKGACAKFIDLICFSDNTRDEND